MKIALAQLTASADKALNLRRALDYIAQAKRAAVDLIVFPEGYMAFLGRQKQLCHADVAESLNGNFVSTLAAAAKQYQIEIICGIFETAPNETQRAYNTVVVLNKAGQLVSSYRKTHLYDAFSYKESTALVAAANQLVCCQTALAKLGLLVCYELRFPEISRTLALQQAQILIVPTAWVAGGMKEQHLYCLAQARALENNLFVCVANQVGNIYTGRSVIFDPMGVAIASAGVQETLLIAELDLTQVEQVRAQLPCLEQRRPELYNLS